MAILFTMAGLGAFMTAKDLVLGEPSRLRCPASDYECNYKRYLTDISRVPEDHSNASAVAIDTPEAVWRNLAAVAELPDREATAMLHVLLAYPREVRLRICQDPVAMGRLQRRGEEIQSEGEYRRYRDVFARFDCGPEVRSQANEPAFGLD